MTQVSSWDDRINEETRERSLSRDERLERKMGQTYRTGHPRVWTPRYELEAKNGR